MNRQIFLDMDGVIVNLQDPIRKLHGFDVNSQFHMGTLEASDQELWSKTDSEWWSNLPWMDDGKDIVALCERIVGDNLVLCTTPAAWPGAAEGKLRWIERELPAYARRFILTVDKWRCASPFNLLIDDSEKNVTAYHEAGGPAILCPRPWNSHQDVPNTVAYLEEAILEMLE